MVFELVYDRHVCKICGERHDIHAEETHHGNQRIVLLTTTGKILPAVMLVVIAIFIVMSATPYSVEIIGFFQNAFAAVKTFFVNMAVSIKAFLGM